MPWGWQAYKRQLVEGIDCRISVVITPPGDWNGPLAPRKALNQCKTRLLKLAVALSLDVILILTLDDIPRKAPIPVRNPDSNLDGIPRKADGDYLLDCRRQRSGVCGDRLGSKQSEKYMVTGEDQNRVKR